MNDFGICSEINKLIISLDNKNMGQNFLCVLFLLGVLAAFGNCEEIDLEGRPTWKPEKEGMVTFLYMNVA